MVSIRARKSPNGIADGFNKGILLGINDVLIKSVGFSARSSHGIVEIVESRGQVCSA